MPIQGTQRALLELLQRQNMDNVPEQDRATVREQKLSAKELLEHYFRDIHIAELRKVHRKSYPYRIRIGKIHDIQYIPIKNYDREVSEAVLSSVYHVAELRKQKIPYTLVRIDKR